MREYLMTPAVFIIRQGHFGSVLRPFGFIRVREAGPLHRLKKGGGRNEKSHHLRDIKLKPKEMRNLPERAVRSRAARSGRS